MSLITAIATGAGTVTITSASHGLANGNIARIVNTNCTPCIDGFYEVSGVSGSNFNISATVTGSGDAGNVGKTFFLDQEGGSDAADGLSFANRWKTITSGATAARIAPDDFIRIMASPAAVSTGQNASFTNLSKDVVLTTAVTKDLATCDATTNWTGATNCTVNITSTMKQGSYAIIMACNSSFTTGKLATYDLYAANSNVEQDLSAYQNISFWFRCNNSAIAFAAGDLKLKLYSDSAGTVEVDSLDLPALTSTAAQYIPITLKKGSALSSTVRAMALYANATMASKTFYIDNVFACNGLHLQCLIGKNAAPTTDYICPEPWYCIQSIVGTTIKIDNDVNCASNAGRGYTGTTESVTLYYRETTQTAMAASAGTHTYDVMDAGVLGQPIVFSGGWNRADMSSKDDITIFDGLNGLASFITLKDFVSLERVFAVRIYDFIFFNDAFLQGISVFSCGAASVGRSFIYSGSGRSSINARDLLFCNPAATGAATSINVTLLRGLLEYIRVFGYLINTGCTYGAIQLSGQNVRLSNIAIKNCAGRALTLYRTLDDVTLDNVVANDCAVVFGHGDTQARSFINGLTYNSGSLYDSGNITAFNSIVLVSNLNSDGLLHVYGTSFEIHRETTVIHTAGRNGWNITAKSATVKNAFIPNWYPVGPFKAAANRACTISLWMRRNSTALSLGIRIRADGRIPGIGSTNKGILAVGTSYNKYEAGTYEGRPWVALANAAFAPVQSANWDYDIRSMMIAAADTWERVSLTFTPTADCLFEPEIICWTTDVTKTGYFHEMTITQQ